MADQNTIAAIKTLRDRTGAGMMDCKKALEATGYDIEKSIDYLREKGIAKQAKRAGRTAAEGLALVKAEGNKAALIEVNCETDFVSASDKFQEYAQFVLNYVLENEPTSIEAAREGTLTMHDTVALATGEKTEFRRMALLTKEDDQGFGTYIHQKGRISVCVLLAKEDEEFAHHLAMHIADSGAIYVNLEDVPASERERELGIAKAEVAADEKLLNKPQQVKDQIAEKKVDKALSQYCLLKQKFLLDPSKTVEQVLAEKGNKVISFVRYQVGEGLAA
ncbi:MAG: translation elongation factor Ts [Mollicutes bacterium]|nr:translation elongation factor Ts [Mollicutes bacterium]MDY6070973.1 translation elongation factor Ts [Bacilli bacterium]